MTATDTSEGTEDASMSDSADDDEELPFAVKVMMVLIVLAILGVVLVDVLHFLGAF
ncbi:hypothetical protein [Haloglomus litoreum]|uniref:hypothetical protein n=1 Tax=Haloglomus litoreum TaxID=3034026 RepID=UPI0023E81A98|nr:hypothetical protein [Haloglomus sp. DT116]